MNKILLSITFSALLITYIVLDIYWDENFWNISKELAISMQESIPIFERIIYEFFTYVVFIPPFCALYCFLFGDRKLNALLYLFVVIISICSNELLKNIYSQARPYMIEEKIQAIKCNPDFGKPSGHSQNSVVMMILLPFLLFPELHKLRKRYINVELSETFSNKQPPTGYTISSFNATESKQQIEVSDHSQPTLFIILKIFLILFLLCSVILTGLSRVFLGVHSLGQVFLGWIYGLYISCMYIFVIHDLLKKEILKNLKYNHRDHRHIITMALLLLIIFMAISLIFLKINLLVLYDEKSMNQWIKQINKCKLEQYTKNSPQILYNSCFSFSAIGSLITGLLVGALLSQGTYEEGQFKYNQQFLTSTQIFYRILMFILPFLILIPFLLIQSDKVLVQTMIQILPISFGIGFIITGVYPYLLRKFNLQIKGDFLYYENSKLLLSDKDLNQLDLQYNERQYSMREKGKDEINCDKQTDL